jgi:hypothetical protein
MTNGLGVMTFQSWPGSLNFVLDRIAHHEKYDCLTPIRKQYQETFNSNIVGNVLSFLTAIYTPYSDKHNKRYSHQKVADQRRFQQKAGNIFSFGARVRICSRTELKEHFGHNEVWLMIF